MSTAASWRAETSLPTRTVTQQGIATPRPMGRARGCGAFTGITEEASKAGTKWRPLSAARSNPNMTHPEPTPPRSRAVRGSRREQTSILFQWSGSPEKWPAA